AAPVLASDLTVPADRWAAAQCQLEPRTTFSDKRLPLGLPSNPWWGTDPELVSRVQAMTVGAAPAVGSTQPAIETAIAAEEAYAAFYSSNDPENHAEVFAVRFTDPTIVGLFSRAGLNRWQVGAFTVATLGFSRECRQAAMAHFASLAR